MGGARYQPEELIKLRESPLVCRPATLPPTEEWMGPPPAEQPQNRRQNENKAKNAGAFGNDSNTRPSLLETRQSTRGSSSLPADIVLGPPKPAFASAGSLKSPRALDSPGRSAFGNFGSDTPRADYFSRAKINGDKDRHEKYPRQQKDGESWGGRKYHDDQRQTENEDGEESEPRGQRAHQSWNNDGKRNGTGREGKSNWSKDDETFGTTKISKEEKDATIDNIRSRAWRGEQGPKKATDWNQQSERKPEWMTDESEPRVKHTAQDIEAWKAQMRAQSKGIIEQADAESGHTRTASGSLKQKSEKPLTLDKNMDTFFNLWGAPQATSTEPTQPSEDAPKTQHLPKGAKASKFSNFFGPATPSTPAGPVALNQASATAAAAKKGPLTTMPPAEESALHSYNVVFNENGNGDDDKAGFDRMLLMLRSSAPVAPIGKPTLPPNATSAQPPAKIQPDPPQSPTIHSPRSQKHHGLEGILGQPQQPKSPVGVINKDTEFLLNLLRKDEGWQQHFPGMKQPGAGPPPGLQQRPADDHFSNENQPPQRHGIDKLNPTANTQRPPQSRFFDQHELREGMPPFNDLQGPRPPNFDHPSQIGFPPMNPMAGRGALGPPPGFPGRQPFPPGLGPAMGNLNLGGHDRGPPFMHQGPLGFSGPLGPHPFPPQGFPPMGPGQFPPGDGRVRGIPPAVDIFGPVPVQKQQQPPPPGFQRD